MNSKHVTRTVLLFAALFSAAVPISAQQTGAEYDGAAALGLALRRVGVTGRVLMIGAHPDDENTAVLAALALEQGAEAAYLSLTRGEGGQNGIGPELQEALGLVRSGELLAARRLDGADQFFTRAYDYGYSKSADEAFRHWPREELLADVVAVVRAFRPDVIITIFTGTPRDGHGQHQAAGIMARAAFEAAGDPKRFPAQLEHGLRPHKPRALYQSRRRTDAGDVRIATGTFDPLLGRSHYQIAMASRSRHRSQDMGRTEPPGPRASWLERVSPAPVAGAPAPSLFTGVPATLADRARALTISVHSDSRSHMELIEVLSAYEAAAADLRAGMNALAPGVLVPDLARALGLLRRAEALAAGISADAAAEIGFHIAAETEDVVAALTRAAGVVVDGYAEDEHVVPGQAFELELTLWNGGTRPLTGATVEPMLPPGWRATPFDSPPPGSLEPGALLTRRFRVQVPADAPPSEPYFLQQPRAGDMYVWPDTDVGHPFEPAPVRVAAGFEVAGAPIALEREATYRGVDPQRGEFRRPIYVVPGVAVEIEPAVAVLPVGSGNAIKSSAPTGTATGGAEPGTLGFSIRLAAEAPGGIAGTLRLELPAGWSAEPEAVPLRIGAPGESRVLDVVVHPPAAATPGEYLIRAVFVADDGRHFTQGYRLVDYPHIRPRPIYATAAASVQAFDVRLPAELRVAYIMGSGDEGPEAIRQLGLAVELLDAAALATADLGVYDVIVTGVRAYEVRTDLIAHNRRLLEYVEQGGTLVVQYNKYPFDRGDFAPYPLTMNRPHDRVTDETAPVELLEPDHPILSWPNRITAADFEGWVQERGLYFAHTWDDRYTPLLAMSDPGEAPLLGSLLVAPHGAGTYVYTGIAFFRQLPAGVPGAYRLFANLLSLGAR